MSLKKTSPASDSSGGAGSGGGVGSGGDAAVAADKVFSGPATSVIYEPENVIVGKGEPKKEKRGAKDKFPGVFGAPATPSEADPEPLVGRMATFDELAPVPSSRNGQGREAKPGSWEIYTVAELVRFRDEITRQLPATELSKLNLEQEVLLQFHTLRELQADVLSAEDIPANQRAQVANSVASILKTLADQQVALYTSERFKDIENLLVRSLSLWPEKDASKFLSEYEEILRNVSK